MNPLIETERLILRPFRKRDFEAVHEYASDPEVVRYVLFGPNTPSQTRQYIYHSSRAVRMDPVTCLTLAAEHREQGRVIGGISLMRKPKSMGRAELGYVYNKSVWGQGIGTEAGRAMLAFGFEELGLHRIYAHCHVDNVASFKLMKAIGMSHEGTLRKHLVIKNEYVDAHTCGVLRQEWQAQSDAARQYHVG